MQSSLFSNSDILTLGETLHPKSIVVALHGITSNNKCMAQALAPIVPRMPETLFIVPNGPIRMTMTEAEIAQSRAKSPDFDVDNPRSWFNLRKLDYPRLILEAEFNTVPAACFLQGMIEEALKDYGLDESRLGIFGMSQGGIIAGYLMLRLRHPPAAVVVHSSMFPVCPAFRLAHQDGLNIFMLTGDQDEYTMKATSFIDRHFQSHEKSKARLAHAGVSVEDCIIPGLNHRTTPETIERSIEVISRRLALTAAHNITPANAPLALSA